MLESLLNKVAGLKAFPTELFYRITPATASVSIR